MLLDVWSIYSCRLQGLAQGSAVVNLIHQSQELVSAMTWNAAPPKKGLKLMVKRPVGKTVLRRPSRHQVRYTRARPANRAVHQWSMDQRFVLTASKWDLIQKLINIGWIRPTGNHACKDPCSNQHRHTLKLRCIRHGVENL